MTLKDKLGAIAKTAADKTGDVVETTKLSIRVNEEKNKIKSCYEKTGKIFYDKFTAGEEFDSDVTDLFCRIKDSEKIITELEEQIKMVKEK